MRRSSVRFRQAALNKPSGDPIWPVASDPPPSDAEVRPRSARRLLDYGVRRRDCDEVLRARGRSVIFLPPEACESVRGRLIVPSGIYRGRGMSSWCMSRKRDAVQIAVLTLHWSRSCVHDLSPPG